MVLFFAVNAGKKKNVMSCNSIFFAVMQLQVYTAFCKKKITQQDDYCLLHAFTTKKNTRITTYTGKSLHESLELLCCGVEGLGGGGLWVRGRGVLKRGEKRCS